MFNINNQLNFSVYTPCFYDSLLYEGSGITSCVRRLLHLWRVGNLTSCCAKRKKYVFVLPSLAL